MFKSNVNGKPLQTPVRYLISRAAMLGFTLFLCMAGQAAWSKSGVTKSGKAAGGAGQESLVQAPHATWSFAVSGDSRNCGDVVMPEIAAGAQAHDAAFYWHLGDFRLGSDVDQDMANEEGYRGHHISVSRYLNSH